MISETAADVLPVAEVRVHLRKRYQCSLCPRSYSSRKSAERHVAECIHDPATRGCATCEHDIFNTGYDEGPPGCALGLRDELTQCVRHCESWALAKRWKR